MKKLTIGLVMLFAVPAILVSGIWGKTIGNFAVAHFTDHRPALTACSDWGSVVVTETWWTDESDFFTWSSEDHPNWSDARWEEEGYTKQSKREKFLYCSPFLTRTEAEDSMVSNEASATPFFWNPQQDEITNDGRYMNDSVRTYSLDVGNFVRASIMLLLAIGGAVLVFGATKSRHRKKVNEIQMSDNKTGDI